MNMIFRTIDTIQYTPPVVDDAPDVFVQLFMIFSGQHFLSAIGAKNDVIQDLPVTVHIFGI
jgi:hypothetical protein